MGDLFVRVILLAVMVFVGLSGSVFAREPSSPKGYAAPGDVVSTRASFSRAVREAAPAVVNIYAERRVMQRAAPERGSDPLMDRLMNNGQGQLLARVQKSLGSGVIVDASGVVVTNLHVINGAEAMVIVLADGREFAARMINSDDKLDLAVLRLDVPNGTRLPAARFGNSDSLQVGDVVLALGNPYGIGQSVSMGIVSAVERSNAALSQYGQFIQTDVAVNPGSSGGALIDSTGMLVGINTAIFSKTGGSVGISFAIPASLVKTVVRDIVTTGKVNRPWLGAVGQNVTQALAARLGMASAKGILVNDVLAGSPAAAAGLKSGDVIFALDGKAVADTGELGERILTGRNLEGRRVPMAIWRGGGKQTLDVQFEALPERNPNDRVTVGGTGPLAGAVVERLGPALSVELDLPLNTQGVVLAEVPPVKGVGSLPLLAGDILLKINNQPLRTLNDVVKATNERAREWALSYQRGGRVYEAVTR